MGKVLKNIRVASSFLTNLSAGPPVQMGPLVLKQLIEIKGDGLDAGD